MNARQAFKHGFMAGCIEAGLTTPAQILDFVKRSSDKLATGVGSIIGLDAIGHAAEGAGHVLGTGLSWGIPLALAGPPLAGAGLGMLASKATDISDYDVDDVKKQEVIDEYSRQAQRLRREGLLRRHLQQSASSKKSYL